MVENSTSMLDAVGARLAVLEQGAQLRDWIAGIPDLSIAGRHVANAIIRVGEEDGNPMLVVVRNGRLSEITRYSPSGLRKGLADLIGNHHALGRIENPGSWNTYIFTPDAERAPQSGMVPSTESLETNEGEPSGAPYCAAFAINQTLAGSSSNST